MNPKFWWKNEPLIAGSLRWRVIDNDLKNTMKEVLEEFKLTTTIDEAVALAHSKGVRASFKLILK